MAELEGGWGFSCLLPEFDCSGGSQVVDVSVTDKPKARKQQRCVLLAQKGGRRVLLEEGDGQNAQTQPH